MITHRSCKGLAAGCLFLTAAIASPVWAGGWQYPGEISVAEAYNDIFFTNYDTTTQEGLAALVADHGGAMQTQWNTSTVQSVAVVAMETSNNFLVGINVDGNVLPLYQPTTWTGSSRGWVDDPVGATTDWSSGVVDIASLLTGNGYSADTPFTFVVGNVTMDPTNTYLLNNDGLNGGFVLAYNEGGLNASDGDANEPILYINPSSNAPGGCGGLKPTIVGTQARDIIYGTEGDDVIMALGGADVIYGYGGNDVICGGDGNDVIHGGDGNDIIFGDSGNDTITGDAGDDVIHGGDGGDTILGGDGSNTMYGDSGDDTIQGGDGDDLMYGGDGNDRMLGYGGNDTMYGGAGNDLLRGDDGDDNLYGGDGDDQIYGNAGNDLLVGGAGNDTIVGYGGNDTLEGDEGDDTLYAGDGDDSLDGGDGTDRCDGSSGTDTATTCEVITNVP